MVSAECVQRNTQRVSTNDLSRANASRTDRLSLSPRHHDSLRAGASYASLESSASVAGTWAATSCNFFSGALPQNLLHSERRPEVNSPSASATAFELLATRANFPLCQLITLTLPVPRKLCWCDSNQVPNKRQTIQQHKNCREHASHINCPNKPRNAGNSPAVIGSSRCFLRADGKSRSTDESAYWRTTVRNVPNDLDDSSARFEHRTV